jgi:hypothetical protein
LLSSVLSAVSKVSSLGLDSYVVGVCCNGQLVVVTLIGLQSCPTQLSAVDGVNETHDGVELVNGDSEIIRAIKILRLMRVFRLLKLYKLF